MYFLRKIKIGDWKRLPVYQALTHTSKPPPAGLPGVVVRVVVRVWWGGVVVVVVMRRDLSKGGKTHGEGSTVL